MAVLTVAASPASAALETTIDSGPSGPTNDSAPRFTFSSNDQTVTGFECAVDADAFGPCTEANAHTTPSLSEGPHSFSVRATDGTTTGAPASVGFTVDVTPPVVVIDPSGPPPVTNSTSASFSFSVSDNLSTGAGLVIECRLDRRPPFEPCSTQADYSGIAEGEETFRARATDEAGNTGAAIRRWTIDLTPPDTTIDSGPSNPTGDTAPTFTFSSDEPGATFSCRMDGGDFVPCPTPFTSAPLSDGTHTFDVLASDAAGNFDASPATYSFTVDTTLPPPPPDPSPSQPSPAAPSPGASVATSDAPVRVAASFVLIARRTIRVSKRRLAPVTLNCAGGKNCAGEVVLTTARRVRVSSAADQAEVARKRRRSRRRSARRRIVKLGTKRFQIPARVTTRIRVRLSRKNYRLVKRLGRVRVMVTVTDRDRAGRLRIGTREIFLSAR